jgi:hypothetical protein
MKSREDFGSDERWVEYLRVYFAGQAMKGILSSGCYNGDSSPYISDIENEAKPSCNDAVKWAEKLIEALNKQP